MKNSIRITFFAVMVAAFLTAPWIMIGANAIQDAQIVGPYAVNFQPNGGNVPNVSTHQYSVPTMAVMAAPQSNFEQSTVRMNWERLETNGINGVRMYRVAVPGGWLLTTQVGNQQAGTTLVFVPDVVHSWGSQGHYPPNGYRPYMAPRASQVPQSVPSYSPQQYNPPRNTHVPNVSRSPNSSPRYPRSGISRPNELQPNDFNSNVPRDSHKDPQDQLLPRQNITPDGRQYNRGSFEAYPQSGQKTSSQDPNTRNPRRDRPTVQLPQREHQHIDSYKNRDEEPATNLNLSQPRQERKFDQSSDVQRGNSATSGKNYEQSNSVESRDSFAPRNNRSKARTDYGQGSTGNPALNTQLPSVGPRMRKSGSSNSSMSEASSGTLQRPLDSSDPVKLNRGQSNLRPQPSLGQQLESNSKKQKDELFSGDEELNVEDDPVVSREGAKNQDRDAASKGTIRNDPGNAKSSKPKKDPRRGSIPTLSKDEIKAGTSHGDSNRPLVGDSKDEGSTNERGTKQD